MADLTIRVPSSNQSSHVNGVLALDLAVRTGMGVLAASTAAISPIAGMAFGAVYFCGSYGAHLLEQWVADKFGGACADKSSTTKVIKFAIAFLAGLVAATATCSALGAPIVSSVGLIMSAVMLATTVTISTFVHNSAEARDVVIGPSVFFGLKC